jgi:hypothetical protein
MSTLHSAILLIIAGVVAILWSWWEWRHADSIKPGSYRYRRYEAKYQATHWVRRRDFSEIADRYVKRVAKRGIIVGAVAIIGGAVLAIIQVP